MPTSSRLDRLGIKELLTQLQTTIADAQKLSTEDKQDRLEQVQAIAELGTTPSVPTKKAAFYPRSPSY